MPYSNLMSRTDMAGLIPMEYSQEIMTDLAEQRSHVMNLARRLRNMDRYQTTMTVISALPTAYFVSGVSASGAGGSAAQKQTTEANWTDKILQAEEIAAIVPIEESVFRDTSVDIWGEIRPLISTAIGKAIDQAVLFGTNKPASWPTAIVTAATSASQKIAMTATGDLYDHVMGDGGLISLVEGSGFMVTGHLAHISMRGKLRGLRETVSGSPLGFPLFANSMRNTGGYDLDGEPITFMTNGSGNASYLMITGAWNQLVYSMRQDITWKILDQAVIQDNTGAIAYNLAQQDMIALRVVVRVGFQVPNPVNWIKSSGQYPFAVLTPT